MISEAMTVELDRAPADLMLSTLYEQVQEAIAAGRSVHFESTCEAGGRVSYYITVPPVVLSVVPAPDYRQLAEEIVGTLFTNGQGEYAARLVMVGEAPQEIDLGGWSCAAAVDAVEKALRGQR